jgi:hypothetical protein
MTLRFLVLALILCSRSTPAESQRPLLEGDVVRVTYACQPGSPVLCPRIRGVVRELAPDSLVFGDEQGVAHRVHLDLRTRVSVLSGKKSNALPGMLLGLLVGVGVGAVRMSDCTTGGSDDGICGIHVVTAVPIGAFVGLLIGGLTERDRWRDYRINGPQGRLMVGPTRRGIAATFAIEF